MKRSEINAMLVWAKNLLQECRFTLPSFAYWGAEEWKQHKDELDTIRKTMLGWDITDYGSGDFHKVGAVLFTIRNGDVNDPSCGTPYCEKVLLMEDGQVLPLHFHYTKTEDIINRGGGTLVIRLYNSKEDESVDYESDVEYVSDGIRHTVHAGEDIEIPTGCSITLTPYVYHLFIAKPGTGDLLLGEVSKINDDNTDNHFSDEGSERFPETEEDEPILHPLCNELDRILS